jgi:hypothetical protein
MTWKVISNLDGLPGGSPGGVVESMASPLAREVNGGFQQGGLETTKLDSQRQKTFSRNAP